MGVCLSCLKSDDDDDLPQNNNNERTPLISDPSADYSYEAQNMERDQQLSNIVNETGHKLIDVTSYARLRISPTQTASTFAVDDLKSALEHMEPNMKIELPRPLPQTSLSELERCALREIACKIDTLLGPKPVIQQDPAGGSLILNCEVTSL